MTSRYSRLLHCALGGVLSVILGGCRPSQSNPLASTEGALQQASGSLEAAFKGADPAMKQKADAIEGLITGHDTAAAFLELNQLGGASTINPQQREAVVKAQSTLSADLRKKASQGDPRAVEALQIYGATK